MNFILLRFRLVLIPFYRCQDKVLWRFKYSKYKPLKTLGACSGCRKKNLRLNYRTFCEECSTSRGVCPSCCEKWSGTNPEPSSSPAIDAPVSVVSELPG
jgi:hypothetical protein